MVPGSTFGTTRSAKDFQTQPATDYIQPTCARFYLQMTRMLSTALMPGLGEQGRKSDGI